MPKSKQHELLESGAVVEAKPSARLRKPVDMLAIVAQKQRITLVSRLSYNVLMWLAQRQGGNEEVFRAPLKDLLEKLQFKSHNTEVIKNYMREMVTTKVEWRSPTEGEGARWGVSALLAHAEIINEKGTVWLEWSYSPKIKRAVLDPERFGSMSIDDQTELNSYAALALYEYCARYCNNPSGLTSKQPLEWFRPVLTGAPEDQLETYTEYKYFKRSVIKPAILEVNRKTDLNIDVIEHRNGRVVTELQFHVQRKSKQAKAPLAGIESEQSLKGVAKAIGVGIAQQDAEALIGKHGTEAFVQGVQALEQRQQRLDLEPIKTPAKYLDTVISNQPEQILNVLSEVKESSYNDRAQKLALLERYRDHQRKKAEALFKESIEADQSALIVEFEMRIINKAEAAILRSYRARGIETRMIRALFLQFLAEHFFGANWQTPSDSALLEFSLQEKS